eukprot:6219692-Pyramimonas_sp.AAC.1
MRLSAELMPVWPRLNLTGVPLAPKPPRPKVEPRPRQWTRVSSFWQCIECLKVAKGVPRKNPDGSRPGGLDPPAPG